MPSHWRIDRLKYVADVRPSNVDKKSYEGDVAVQLCNYTDVYYQEQITSAPGLMEATATPEQVARFGLCADDVIITKDSETSDDIAISAHVPETLPGVVCGYHLALLRPRDGASGAFIKRYFDSRFAKASVAVRANGLTRVGLGQYALDNLLLPIPPRREQLAIAAFLDRETAKIDALVEAQQRLIELLKEKRQAVISHAVTKGLDPKVPMKDSGVEWLGEVPAHWTIDRLSHVADFLPGKAHEPYVDDDGEFIYVSARFVSTGGSSVKHCSRNLRPAKAGDILMVMSDLPGGRALARAFLVGDDRPYAVNQRVCIVRPREIHGDYLFFQMDRNPGLLAHDDGANQTHLSNEDYTTLPLLVPPIDEQRRIGSFLIATTCRIDALIREADAATALLSERRTALISAAVTGKIDVRGAACEAEAA